MARFSLDREEDDGDEGPGSSRPNAKKQRTASNTLPSHPQAPPAENSADEELVEEEGGEIDEKGSEDEVETEEEESDYQEEEDGEDEQCEDELENQEALSDEGPNRDGSISVTLTDTDVLDCPICLEPLSIPVFQCENGHVACSSCCLKIVNRCPSCCMPIGYNRCRAIEKVLESVKISCRNVKYGCSELLKYCNKHQHENSCTFAPCLCPLLDCNYASDSCRLYSHFESKHLSSAKRFVFNCLFSVCLERNQKFLILQERSEHIIFIVNHFGDTLGSTVSAVSVVCIGPATSGREFSYEITTRDGGTSIKLQSFVESIPKWVDVPPARNFLLVPNHYTSARGQLNLEICIRKIQ